MIVYETIMTKPLDYFPKKGLDLTGDEDPSIWMGSGRRICKLLDDPPNHALLSTLLLLQRNGEPDKSLMLPPSHSVWRWLTELFGSLGGGVGFFQRRGSFSTWNRL